MANRGCSLFMPLAELFGVAFSELNFILTQLTCLVLALLYRRVLPPNWVRPSIRHGVSLVLGILVGFFYYGVRFKHVLLQSVIGYLATRLTPSKYMHGTVFISAMFYLVYVQAERTFFTPVDLQYRLDVTGALMVSTQKITGIAFGLLDGREHNTGKMSVIRQRMALKKTPSALEYFSYIFFFPSVLIGPMNFFLDYIDFIEGDVTRFIDRGNSKTENNNKTSVQPPPPLTTVCKKLCVAAFWCMFHMIIKPYFPGSLNADPEFASQHSFLYRCFVMYLSMLCFRAKYYIAFSLSDAACNMAGYGFNGFDQDGRARWDLVSNVNILGIEFGTSMKTYIDSWNIQSSLWLRHICYDRVPAQKTLLTFLLSAIWHGLYPGYYLSFIMGWPLSMAAKKMRRCLRPHFQSTNAMQRFYDVITWFTTQVALSYMFVPFTLLHLNYSLLFYSLNFWWLHIAVGFVLLLPSRVLRGGAAVAPGNNGTVSHTATANVTQEINTTVNGKTKTIHTD